MKVKTLRTLRTLGERQRLYRSLTEGSKQEGKANNIMAYSTHLYLVRPPDPEDPPDLDIYTHASFCGDTFSFRVLSNNSSTHSHVQCTFIYSLHHAVSDTPRDAFPQRRKPHVRQLTSLPRCGRSDVGDDKGPAGSLDMSSASHPDLTNIYIREPARSYRTGSDEIMNTRLRYYHSRPVVFGTAP